VHPYARTMEWSIEDAKATAKPGAKPAKAAARA
jgi:hypothetical protein